MTLNFSTSSVIHTSGTMRLGPGKIGSTPQLSGLGLAVFNVQLSSFSQQWIVAFEVVSRFKLSFLHELSHLHEPARSFVAQISNHLPKYLTEHTVSTSDVIGSAGSFIYPRSSYAGSHYSQGYCPATLSHTTTTTWEISCSARSVIS